MPNGSACCYAWAQPQIQCADQPGNSIAIRLGRNAVLQAAMSTRWWESFSAMVCDENRAATGDVWTSDTFILGSIAQLLAAIQDHLCECNK